MKNFKSFTCPMCEIEQHDLCIEDSRLLNHPERRWTIYRCLSCGSKLGEVFLTENGSLPE